MDAYEEEQQALRESRKQRRLGEQRNLVALQRMRDQQAADAEAERKAIEAAANVPAPATTEYDMSKGYIQNGTYVLRPEPQPSQATIKVQQLTAMNHAALKK
jgi:hypothetical protein